MTNDIDAAPGAAADEVASYENRLTRLTTLVRFAIGILVVLLGSQATLWAEYGTLSGQLSRIATQVDQIARAVAH
jgi:hypothetical protein